MKQFVSIAMAMCFLAAAMLVIGVYFGGHIIEEQLTELLEEYKLVEKTEEETVITENMIEETIIEEEIIKETTWEDVPMTTWDCN